MIIKQPTIKPKFIIGGISLLILFLHSCQSPSNETDSEVVAKADVMTMKPLEKDTSTYREYEGITQFAKHIDIRAQSSGFISKSFLSAGQRVTPHQLLFTVKSRETTLLGSAFHNSKTFAHMEDSILSQSTLIINKVMVQQGDFVQVGDLLASGVNTESLHILMSVPVEMNTSNIENKTCQIILPDERKIKGKVGYSLPIADNTDQTNQFLITPEISQRLPENIHVKIEIQDQEIKDGIFIPKSAVYSNEELTKYWVMKVIHDSLALKIPIHRGYETDSLVQITNSNIGPTDNLIYRGGYGLADSSYVNVIQ